MLPTTCLVALPIPAQQPYSYAIPAALADRVAPGARVVVPVRARELVGVVIAVDDSPANGLKSVLLAPDHAPLLPEGLLKLGQWIAQYYISPLGLTFKAMLPPGLWGSSKLVAEIRNASAAAGGASQQVLAALERAGGRAEAKTLARKLKRPVWDTLQRLARSGAVALETQPPQLGPAAGTKRVLILTKPLPSLIERENIFGRAARQRAAFEAVDAMGGEAGVHHLREQLDFSPAVLKGLVERGVASFEERERLRDPFDTLVGEPLATPTTAQQDAIRQIQALEPGKAVTLFGVTGSGKTLVYLESLRSLIHPSGGAMVLVPEISLTPQTIGRVRGAFGDTVAVLHSGLSEAERTDAWRALATGVRRIAVGARSAVFAPIPNLQAIVVDEEHDASYKHAESPRYHARDVALKRGSLEGARVVLGSATPSLETWSSRERIRVISLPQRIHARPLPSVTLVDMRSAPQIKESGLVSWSRELDNNVALALEKNEQVILLLNRRGFAHFLQCPHCGVVCECPHCSISLTVHRTPASLRCHYCGHHESVPTTCAHCGHDVQRTRGVGTQLLEQWLAERFPTARLARMDADTTSAKWSHRRILDAVSSGDVDILFGTQMVAKGLDFPDVTVVGVVNADTGLHLPDFRAAERTFQLIAQVAGRAGRGPKGGRVIVQTRSPDHYSMQAASKHDFESFAVQELVVRKSPPYPPHVSLVNVVLSGTNQLGVTNAAVEVAEWLEGLVVARAKGAVDVVGPAPAPLARIKQRWRWHILLRSSDRSLLDRITRYAATRAPHTGRGHVRVVFDRDPVSLL